MKKMLITCDHCKKEVNEMHDYPNQEISFIGYETADLCADCINEMQRMINKFCGKEGNNDRT